MAVAAATRPRLAFRLCRVVWGAGRSGRTAYIKLVSEPCLVDGAPGVLFLQAAAGDFWRH